MNQDSGKRQVSKLIHTFGCLPDAPDGPIIERFNSLELAQALESEISRAMEYGWSKITLHMDLPDAALLSKTLRKKHASE